MQRYRQSVAYRQSIVSTKLNDGGDLNLTESFATYRGSWNPQWMDTNHWVGKIKLPSEFMADIFNDGDDSDNECDKTISMRGHNINVTKIDLSQAAVKEKWFPLLCNAIRAVVHATPWDGPMSEKDREIVLLVVLDRFLKHADNREVMGQYIKDLLSTIKKEKPTFEIQLTLIRFMSDTWDGEADRYRRLENFKNPSDFEAFQEKCQKTAQTRLHQINSEISKVEANIAGALKHWASVKQSCSCYRGGTHSESTQQSETSVPESGNNRMSVADIRRAQMNIMEPESLAEGKVLMMPNVINIKVESAHVVGINSSTGKRPILPSNTELCIQYFHGNKEVESKDIKGRAQSGEHDQVIFKNSSETAFAIPRTPLPNTDGDLENLDRCYFLITVEEAKMCGIFGGKHLAQVRVPLRTLYEDISPLDSKDRRKVIKERKAKDDRRELGIHFSKSLFVDNYSGLGLEVSLSMTCACDIHNRQPPSVDVLKKEKEQEERRVMSERRSVVQVVDHHKAACDLAEVLGELNDAEIKALQRYCDRYLIHDELLQILSLKGFATCGNFSNKETREGMKDAVDVIVSLKGTLTTYECESIVDNVINTVKSQCFERILDIDEVCNAGTEQGPEVIRVSKKILESLSVKPEEIEKAVRERAVEIAHHFSHKLEKLLYLFPVGAEGKSFIPSDKYGNRMSVLVELAQKEDSGTIMAKARTFYEIVDNGFYVMCHLLEFALKTKDELIIMFATYRMDVCLEKITPVLATALTAFFAELIQSKQFDPLGDAFGVVTLLYQKVMEVVAMIDEIPELKERCLSLLNPFKDYLPTWFSLCLVKTPFWAKVIVQSEPLEAISPGKIFCNEAAASIKSLMDALFDIFDKVIGWRDPEESFLYITSFSKLIAALSESCCDQLIEKGKDAEDPVEWMVCCATLIKFETTVELFWQDKIFTRIVKEFGDNDGILYYQCHAVKASSIAEISAIKDKFFGFIGQMIEGAVGIFFNTACEEAAKITGITSKGSESFNRAFVEIVAHDIMEDISIITQNTDQVTVGPVLKAAVTGLHNAFQNYVLELGPHLDQESVKPHFYAALQGIEDALKPLEKEGSCLVSKELLFDLSHKNRALVHLVCQSSADLIQSLDGKRGHNVNENERFRLIEILQSRTNDKVASQYLKHLDKNIN